MMLKFAYIAIAIMAGFSAAGIVWYGWSVAENIAHKRRQPKPAEPAKAKAEDDEE